MQQRLDNATAEELFNFPMQSRLNLKVSEDYGTASKNELQKKRSASEIVRQQVKVLP